MNGGAYIQFEEMKAIAPTGESERKKKQNSTADEFTGAGGTMLTD